MNDEKYAYVIMPVGSDPIYPARRAAIQRGILAAGLTPRFPAYSLDKPSFNLPELTSILKNAEIVVVDLSHERPSCYYELGLAEALGKKVVPIAERGTPIHQFSARSLMRFYDKISDVEKTIEDILLMPAL